LGGSALPSLEKDSRITLPIRRVSFQGSTSQALVIYMPQNGCLRVLDSARGDQITYEHESRFLVDAIPLSDLSNITVDNKETAQIPFLKESEHTWCYYFAKAELARQREDWNQVIRLMEDARSLGYTPEDPFELLTYIEAQAHTKNIEAAQELSADTFRQEKRTRKGLCLLWQRAQGAMTAPEDTAHINQILSDFQCTQLAEPSN
jgi:hypothetical protein